MMKSRTMLAIAWVACAALAVGATAGCETPPVSPSNAAAPTIAPAHASPDPPPARQVIVEDAGGDAGRVDAGALDLGGGLGVVDGGAMDADGGGGGGSVDAGPGGGALSSAWQSTVSGADAKVAALRPKFRACYTRSIKGRPQGRVVLHASVAADGSVLAVTAGESQGVTGRVVACMVDVMKGTRLPAPGRATTLDVPIAFPAP